MKKIPMRMCVGCREMKEKRDLIRVVRTAEHGGEIDLTGKKSGRGAYICRSRDCLELAKKGRKLERGLKCAIPDEIYEILEKELS